MVVHRRILDALIRHRIDLERYSKHEAFAILRILEEHDAELVSTLRRRLPHLRAGDIHGARAKLLIRRVREMRQEAMRAAHGKLRADMLGLAKLEAEVMGEVVEQAMPIRLAFNPVRAAALRQAVTSQPFAGGANAVRTLSQWWGKLAADDQQRLLGTIQLGIRNQDPIDVVVRRVAGTRANKYRDGILAISRRDAETAVRTAVNHVSNAAQVEWGRANTAVVPGWQWVGMFDERLCDLCRANVGKFVANGEGPPPEGMEVTEQTPPIHPRDRCTLVPVIDPSRLASKVPDRIEEAA